MPRGAMRVEGDDRGLPDTKRFLALLDALRAGVTPPGGGTSNDSERHELALAAELFDWSKPLVVTRAPGRLDVMGGIADYSGSLVLQMPTAEACHVAIQVIRAPPSAPSAPPTSPGPPPSLRIVSLSAAANHRVPSVSLPLARLLPALYASPPHSAPCALDYASAHALLAGGPAAGDEGEEGAAQARESGDEGGGGGGGSREGAEESGAAEQGGGGGAGGTRRGWGGGGAQGESGALGRVQGVAVVVASEVPEGVGVASSAAVEVASMMALMHALGMHVPPWHLARMCQMVENRVVGAPCGIMDQMAVTLARPASLLALLCRPASVQGCLALPPHVALWGIDSGARHSVGGAGYGGVRAAAFMGLTLINVASGESSEASTSVSAAPHDLAPAVTQPLSCLCELDPHSLPLLEPILPATMHGSAFLARHASHGDPATTVAADLHYPVRPASRHPVMDHFRTRCFRSLLLTHVEHKEGGKEVQGKGVEGEGDEGADEGGGAVSGGGRLEQMALLGELMMQSHASYTACGLGSPATDLIVALARTHMGPHGPLWGAKITGGGSGGTVCVLGDSTAAAQAAVDDVCRRFENSTGHRPHLFRGSSPGAAHFGHLVLYPL
ncbi:unnamed protein product [Closterium sp. NIES-65]|nr:unnamed protein product [Closterium sp. NIES-65]